MTDETRELPGVTHWDGCGAVMTPEHEGCRVFISTDQPPPPPPERAILQDLIAELRAMPGFLTTQRSSVDRLADRAEARLREVQGE